MFGTYRAATAYHRAMLLTVYAILGVIFYLLPAGAAAAH